MTDSPSKALERLLKSLRWAGGEVQLTQALAAFANTDSGFAAGLAAAFLSRADETRKALLGPVPPSLSCQAEYVLDTGRRVDLLFESVDREFGLLVELKIDAGYQHEQLIDYVRAADDLGFLRAGLCAVTKSPAWIGEDEVADDARWLGSVRWSQIYRQLQCLHHRTLDEAWKAFLAVVRDQGDFGVVALDQTAVRAWPLYRDGASILKALMEELALPALEVVREETSPAHGESASDDAAVLLRKGVSPVHAWIERIHLQLAVPADAAPEERLRIQFFASDRAVHFCVEARYPDARNLLAGLAHDEELIEVTDKLRRVDQPFESGHDWESYWTRWHDLGALIGAGDNPVAQLLTWVREDVRELSQSGLFTVLERLSREQGRSAQQPRIDDRQAN